MIPKHSAIGDALFTKTQQRVLGLLFGQPEQSYYLNEIVRLAAIGKGTVKRELEKLCSAGLLTVTRQGNQNHYQANSKSPIFKELISLTLKTFGVADCIKAALVPVLAEIETAFIYGSIAKGTEHAQSDIDLLLVGDPAGVLSYGSIMALLEPVEKQLGRSINPTIYSCEEFAKRIESNQSFVTRVMDQPKLWIKGGANGE